MISFCCPPSTQDSIKDSPVFAALSALADIVFLDNSEILEEYHTKHRSMTDSVYLALRHARTCPGHTVLVFLNPDVIVSRELFPSIADAMGRGKKALMMTGLRTRVDQVCNLMEPYRKNLALDIAGSDLSRIAMDNLHPYCSGFIWNRESFPASNPAIVLFETKDRGLLQHCFHLHPIAMVCPETLPVTQDTVDGDFLEKSGLKGDDFEVVNNGEGAVVIEMSGEPYEHPDRLRPRSRRRVAEFAIKASDTHYNFFWQRIDFARDVTTERNEHELERLLRYIKVHEPRRRLRQKYPKLDRRLFRQYFRVKAWLVTLSWPRLNRFRRSSG
ncbi:MAG: hypothetical protein AAF557_18585 [Pseudomonadota bacterium]